MTFYDDLLSKIIIGLIVFAIVGIVGYFLRKRVILHLRKIWAFLLNTNAKISLFYTQKYEIPPKKWLSDEIYDELKERVGYEIKKKAISSRQILLETGGIESPISLEIMEEPELSTLDAEETTVDSYNVTISLQNKIRIGIRDIDDLQEFITVANEIHSIVKEKCFGSQNPKQKFLICDIGHNRGIVLTGAKEIDDNKLVAKISIKDNDVKIILKEPNNLIRAIKKYFIS
jgi:hypothetical protein